jgi:hypothetical protein
VKKRKSTGKRQRFEIFKRDGFRCVYCGATPVRTPLHVDHVVAVANGGTNDPANLVTACADCNGGKSSIPLEAKRLAKRPAAEELRDHAEQIREFLAAQREVDAARREAVGMVAEFWTSTIGLMSQKMYDRLGKVVQEWPHESIVKAIQITAARMGTPGEEYDWRCAENQAKYFQAVLRNWRNGIFSARGE